MEQNYDHLVGKKVQATYDGYDVMYTVSGIDPEVGITLTPEDEGEYNQLCLVEPTIHAQRQQFSWSPEALERRNNQFIRVFRHWVEGIEAGEFTQQWRDYDLQIDKTCGIPTSSGHPMPRDMCPFT